MLFEVLVSGPGGVGGSGAEDGQGPPGRERTPQTTTTRTVALFKILLVRDIKKFSLGHRKGGVLLLNIHTGNAKHFEILVGVRVNEVWAREIVVRIETEKVDSSSI